jgi:hypothetical protein
MSETTVKTIRFRKPLLDAIQSCADARDKSFSEVVVETCEERLLTHTPSIADWIKSIETRVEALEKHE